MKKIVITLTAAILVCLSMNSFAAPFANPLKNYNSNRIISTYIEMISSGNYEWSEHLLAKDFEYVNDVNQTKNSRSEYLRFLKKNKGLKYDCTSKFEILDEVGNTSIAKVAMDFGHFTRVDYITLSRVNDGWQVSKVVTTYP